MNRFKKEEKKRKAEARKGLSTAEIEALDMKEALQSKMHDKAHALHMMLFKEEYDYMGDSHLDIEDRNKGRNPMSLEYINKIKKKRDSIGVPQLSESGMAIDNTTYEICLSEIIAKSEHRTTEWTKKLNTLKKERLKELKDLKNTINEQIQYIVGIDPSEPNTWSELMIENAYKRMEAADKWELESSITFEEFKKQIFADKNFARSNAPRKGMDQAGYNP